MKTQRIRHTARHTSPREKTHRHTQRDVAKKIETARKNSADVLPFTSAYNMTRPSAWPMSNWPMLTWPLHIINLLMMPWQPHRIPMSSLKTESYENKDAYFYAAELPGIRREDISLAIQNHSIVMDISHTRDNRKKGREYSARDTLHRSFPIPIKTDGRHIKATLKDGLLTIAIPKSERHVEALSDRVAIH